MLESAIEERIVHEWSATPFADAGVQLHTGTNGDLIGREHSAGRWAIDLLGFQEAEHCWWIIELKRASASDKAVGQIARSMGWVGRNLTESWHRARGIVLARPVGPGLDHACHALPNIEPWTVDEMLEIHAA